MYNSPWYIHVAIVQPLAYELTALVHGEEEAKKCEAAAKAVFSGTGESADMPSTAISDDSFTDDKISVIDILIVSGLASSRGEARRLIEQGGISVDGEKVTSVHSDVNKSSFEKGHVIIKKGKKVFHKITL